jgi:hypothetical protein
MIQPARRAILILLAGLAAYDIFAWYLAATIRAWQHFALAGGLFFFVLLSAGGLLLAQRARARLGLWLAFAALILSTLLIGALVSGLGLWLGLAVAVLGVASVVQTMPRRLALLAGVLAVLTGLAVWLGDSLAAGPSAYRLPPLGLVVVVPVVAGGMVIVHAIFMGRGVADLSLRAKLILAFLAVTLVPFGALATVDYRA